MGTQNKWAAMHMNYNLSSGLRPLHALRKAKSLTDCVKKEQLIQSLILLGLLTFVPNYVDTHSTSRKSLYKFCFYTQANEGAYPLSRLQNEKFDYNYRLTASMSK